MGTRTIAIGDIHGCPDALSAILDAICPGRNDTIVTLGDYIDRGPGSRRVIEQLVQLGAQCRVIPLLGNHEEALLQAIQDKAALPKWLNLGGMDTLRSYGWVPGSNKRGLIDWFPSSHLEFLRKCSGYFETHSHIFVHAGYVPDLPLSHQPDLALRWRVTDKLTALPHQSAKIAVVGHTPQQSGEVLDLGFLICIDTNCVRGGWLSALDVETGQIWQADQSGKIRSK